MLQGWQHKVVAILLYHDCIMTISTRLLQAVNSLFQTCWQLVTSRANTTCWRLVCRLATSCEIFTCVRAGKNQLFTKRLLKLLRIIRIYTKFANFAGLDFPIKFRDQTQSRTQSPRSSWSRNEGLWHNPSHNRTWLVLEVGRNVAIY